MKEKLRMILAVTGIFLLLPLLLTVFLSGREALHIKKQWNMESLLPMLMCREIPWEYEEEMKKVQAVLTRSSLYLRIEEEKMDGEAWGN
ncbi:MAG: SpoIID/LytB domain-containing protein, partial [Ruminococcus sp.]|nr:SpoIID/LytB domain-containing protein [Ruminococcus sp.]